MKALDKLLLGLGLVTTLVLVIVFLPKLNVGLSTSLGTGAATFFNGIWIAIQIVFFVGIGLGITFAFLKFKQIFSTQVIRDSKDGRATRIVIHKGQVVQIAPGGTDLLEVMKIQQQQSTHMQQHWKMIGTATASMKRFMDEYAVEEEGDDDGVVDGTVETKLIEGPRTSDAPDKVYNLIDQINARQTLVDEEESILGYVNGEPVRGRLFDDDKNIVDSVFVFGDSGFGKSVFAVYMHALNVLHGGKTLIIDPDAEIKQSLTRRLGPLANPLFLLCPIASTPQDAMRLLDLAEEEIADPGDDPALLLVDELTMIMRSIANKGKWCEVGKRLADILENWATRGRKRKRRAIVFGQITKATRSGGTELRDSMTTVCFHLKKQRASTVLHDGDLAEIAPTLKMGEILIIPARSSEASYQLQLAFPDDEALDRIARTMLASDRLNQANVVSRNDELNGNAETAFSPSGNGLETTSQEQSKIIDGVFPTPENPTVNQPNFTVSKEIRETIKRMLAMPEMSHRKVSRMVGLGGRNYPIYQQVCKEEGIVIAPQDAAEEA